MLEVSFVPASHSSEAPLVAFTHEKGGWLGQAKAHAALLTKVAAAKRFSGKPGSTIEVTPAEGPARLLVIGAGTDLTSLKAEHFGAKAFAALELSAGNSLAIDAAGLSDDPAMAAALASGAVLRAYRFDHYRTTLSEAKKPSITKLEVTSSDPAASQLAFETYQASAEGVFETRDLVSEPANILHPESFADRAAELGKLGLEITVLDKAAMEAKGWGALLGVAQGSVREPRVVVMHWKGSDDQPVAMVGKGVTFDTGGISLKPPAGMEDMKWDMGGAGVVTGLMKALAMRKAKANVVGIIGLVENMPDGNAQRPGDVVTSLSGQTIEVLNTDAEGRLVLADVLWHVQETYKPSHIVDLATLTGAMLVALGMEQAGMFANDDALADGLIQAAETSGDALWRMPLGSAYNKQLDSPIADMKNIGGGRWGGSITAACFLERFIQDGVAWAHLDIAGVTWSDKGKPLSRKGATGWGVRLLDQWIRQTKG